MTPTILDCTPSMADVLAGAVSRPRPRQPRENAFQWLKQTPVMARLETEFPEFRHRWPSVQHRPDVKPLPSLGLAAFPECFLLIWERAADASAHTRLLFVNEDGTRCALLGPVELLVETWAKMRRTPGRPPVETASLKTLAQRKWRAKKAAGE